MRAVRRDADEYVTGSHVGGGQEVGPVDQADERAGDVERALGVHAGHLGGLAAEQHAPARLARLGHSGDDLGDMVGIELARGDVVEEEQR